MEYIEEIKKYLDDKAVNKTALAKYFGVSVTTLHNYLSGRTIMSMDFYQKLCEYLDVPHSQFMTNGSEPIEIGIPNNSNSGQVMSLLIELKDAHKEITDLTKKVAYLESQLRDAKEANKAG